MASANTYTAVFIVILVAAAVAVWYYPENRLNFNNTNNNNNVIAFEMDSPWDSTDPGAVQEKLQSWLGTEQGTNVYGNSTAGESVPVFREDQSLFLWLTPVIDEDGMFIGYIQSTAGSPGSPALSKNFGDPRATFINRESAINTHTYIILSYGRDYSPDDIAEPYIVVKDDGGFYWKSLVYENGQPSTSIYIPINEF